jgi:hypothetical protein
MNLRSTLLLIVGVSLIASMLLHHSFAGAYVYSTASDRYTYWIGPVSTGIPFVFWAVVTIFVASIRPIRREQHDPLLAILCGYIAGWLGMTAFTVWIVSLPRGPEHSSTIGIAVALTPFLFAPIFPILFSLGYFIARVFCTRRYEPGKV